MALTDGIVLQQGGDTPRWAQTRRYRHRWKAERSISWLYHFRGLVVCYEHDVTIFTGLAHLACALVALMTVMK